MSEESEGVRREAVAFLPRTIERILRYRSRTASNALHKEGPTSASAVSDLSFIVIYRISMDPPP
ncbi:hypothetical protein M3625_08785 [Paenibacillus sp. MER 78]|nr:hypothetical protein [Paenibacillus sp. MER 78]